MAAGLEGRVRRGLEEPTELDRQRARALACGGVASGALAGVLHGLDSVELDDRPLRRRILPEERVGLVHGVRCANGLQTLIDLAATLTDDVWEQALRKGLVSIGELTPARASRIRRVLARRPPGAPPTESLLETLMIQLIRTAPGLPEPVRQLEVPQAHARLDQSWPEIGLFIELDGQHHKGQPVLRRPPGDRSCRRHGVVAGPVHVGTRSST